MGTVIFAIILVAIILYLVTLVSGKASQLEDEQYDVERRITELQDNFNKRLEIKEHNNLILTQKNRQLQNNIDEITNVVNGERTAEDKVNKIKELLSSN